MKKAIKAIALFVVLSIFIQMSSVMQIFAAAPDITIKNAKQTIWMIEEDGEYKNEILLIMRNREASGVELWSKVILDSGETYTQSLGTLESGDDLQMQIFIPEVKEGANSTIYIYDNEECEGEPVSKAECALRTVRKWTFYVAQDMHMDIGFTEYQESLLYTKYPEFYEKAIEMIDRTKDNPEGSKFIYPSEQAYLIYGSAFRVQNADFYEQILECIKNGTITYPISFGSIASEGAGAEALVRSKYFGGRYLYDMTGTESTKVFTLTDNPGFSWSDIDIMAQAGAKYMVYRPNWDTTNWNGTNYPKVFYLNGQTEGNRILIWNSLPYGHDEYGLRESRSNYNQNGIVPAEKILEISNTTRTQYHKNSYPYDCILLDFTEGGDNGCFNSDVIYNIKALNERKTNSGQSYAYPKFVYGSANQFFEHIEEEFADQVPSYTGGIENYWNHGPGSVSYETGIVKENHQRLPFAEALATLANFKDTEAGFPYADVRTAYEYMTLYDEHTFGSGPSGCKVDDVWVWKRNTALGLDSATDKLINQAMDNINALIESDGNTFVVYNNLSWERTDVVYIQCDNLPEFFEIKDMETGESVRYQFVDGKLCFEAKNVPANGYKCFSLRKTDAKPEFESTIQISGNVVENNFYKITFDATGSISSIIDKTNGNVEMVDQEAPYAFNQFIYINTKTDRVTPEFEGTIQSAQLSAESGDLMCIISSVGNTGVEKGTDSIERKVILYENIARIDFENTVVKKEAPKVSDGDDYQSYEDEEGFFAFPFKMDNFTIKHEMPTGDVTPGAGSRQEGESDFLYSSTTDFYSVNTWIDISNNENYGISFHPINSTLVQYGEIRSYNFGLTYETEEPWIYSWVYNNKWWTNFQKTQPGPVTFKYSVSSRTGDSFVSGETYKKGQESGSKLEVSFMESASDGQLSGDKMSFINIDKENVLLTALKPSEANGEGIIFRFNEITGADTDVTVDLSFFDPQSVKETDLVENDLETSSSNVKLDGNKLTFTIPANGWVTVRVLTKGDAPAKVSGVEAKMDDKGTLVTWDKIEGASYYEIYRSKNENFTAGAGTYIDTVSENSYYDDQVKNTLDNSYYYIVRAVKNGVKGEFSQCVKAENGTVATSVAPSAPSNVRFDYVYSTRVSIRWEPSTDDIAVAGYKIYANGMEIADVSSIFQSYLDYDLTGEVTEYTIRAYDRDGNMSEESNKIAYNRRSGEYSGTISRYVERVSAYSDNPQNADSGNSFIIIISVVCGIVIAGGAAGIVIVAVRKKKVKK